MFIEGCIYQTATLLLPVGDQLDLFVPVSAHTLHHPLLLGEAGQLPPHPRQLLVPAAQLTPGLPQAGLLAHPHLPKVAVLDIQAGHSVLQLLNNLGMLGLSLSSLCFIFPLKILYLLATSVLLSL